MQIINHCGVFFNPPLCKTNKSGQCLSVLKTILVHVMNLKSESIFRTLYSFCNKILHAIFEHESSPFFKCYIVVYPKHPWSPSTLQLMRKNELDLTGGMKGIDMHLLSKPTCLHLFLSPLFCCSIGNNNLKDPFRYWKLRKLQNNNSVSQIHQ